MDYEEWKEKVSKEKAEISKADLIKVCSRIANAASEPENETAGILNASMEMLKVLDEFFPEKKEEEPDAEKSAEKTELMALKDLLFEQAHLAVEQYAAEHSEEAYGKFNALFGLVRDAGLEARYCAWKEEKGYE
jgi:hypothetical protein